MQPQTQGKDCSVDSGEEGAASSLFHSKHGEDGRGKKTGTKMAKKKRREDVLLFTCSTEHGASSPEATNQNTGL